MENEKVYPVSEIFTSVQGEGLYTGSRMTFVRLAGCNVGKPYNREERFDRTTQLRILEDYQERCTLYDGRTFPCDTDYRVKERLTVTQILERVPTDIRRVCITGGEPMIHNLLPLARAIWAQRKMIHLETSGTKLLHEAFGMHGVGGGELWITVSPKKNCQTQMIEKANEIKLLVDESFDVEQLPTIILTHSLVWLHPVNFEHSINPENIRRIWDLQKQFPRWRIGLQLHKVLEEYLRERIL